MENDPTQPQKPASRIFRDVAGRDWRATLSESAGENVLEFICLGESREHARVVAVSAAFSIASASDDSLRGWLAKAPRLERFTE